MGHFSVCFLVEQRKGVSITTQQFIEEPGSHYGVSFLMALSSLPLHRGGSDLGSAYLRMTDNRNRLFIPAASHKKGNSVT